MLRVAVHGELRHACVAKDVSFAVAVARASVSKTKVTSHVRMIGRKYGIQKYQP